MERPTKRLKLTAGIDTYDDDTDELDFEPQQLNTLRDPSYQLEKSRAFAALKLKSTFESIFAKYSKDLTGVSDEIDLVTGEVVVDNGHLASLQDADLGDKASNAGDQSDTASLDEEERILQGRSKEPPALTNSMTPMSQRGTSLSVFNKSWLAQPSLLHRPQGMSNLTPRLGMDSASASMAFDPYRFMSDSMDPNWRTPELPAAAFENLTRQSFGSCSQVKRSFRGLLSSPGEGDQDEDDILLGLSAPLAKQQDMQLTARPSNSVAALLPSKPPSLMIEARHPTVGSSSNEVVSSDASKAAHAPSTSEVDCPPAVDSASKSKPVTKRPVKKSSNSASASTSAKSRLVGPSARKKPAQPREARCVSDTLALRTRDIQKSNGAKSEAGIDKPGGKRRKSDSETMEKPDAPTEPCLPSKEQAEFLNRRQLRSSRTGADKITPRDVDPEPQMAVVPGKEQELDSVVSDKTQLLVKKTVGRLLGVRPKQPLSDRADRAVRRRSERITQGCPADAAKVVQSRTVSRLSKIDVDDSSAAKGTTLSQATTGPLESNTKSDQAVGVVDAAKQPVPETFTRHVQDPSYDFSDEDVPVQITKSGRKGGAVCKEGNQPNVLTRKRTRATTTASLLDKDLQGEEDAAREALPQESSESCPGETLVATEVESAAEHGRVTRSSREKKLSVDQKAADEKKSLGGKKTHGGKSTPAGKEPPIGKTAPEKTSVKKASEKKKSEEKKSFKNKKTPREDKPHGGENSTFQEKTLKQKQILAEETSSRENETPDDKTPDKQTHPEKVALECNSQSAAPIRPPREQEEQNLGSTHGTKNMQIPATPSNGDRPAAKGSNTKMAVTSSAKRSIVSLVSDNDDDNDDEDELSLGPSAFTPLGSRSHMAWRPWSGPSPGSVCGSARRTSTMRHSLLAVSSPMTKPGTSGVRIPRAFDVAFRSRRASRGKEAKTDSSGGSDTGSAVGSELICTPGGSVRRCGEHGFRCERDFCFVCL